MRILNSALVESIGGTPNASTNLVTYLRQDAATGDVVELGDDGGGGTQGEALVTPQVVYPGTWSPNVALNSTLDFGNGFTQQYALNVIGTSAVDTPVGGFNVWTTTANAGSGVTYLWAPQLGAPVKINFQSAVPGQGSITAILQSTTVPH